MPKRDYYRVLDLARNASEAEIKKAYRRLAMKFHPDRNPGDHDAEEKFKEAKEAYEVLSETQKRAVYDQYGHAGVEASRNAHSGASGFTGAEAFRDSFGDVDETRPYVGDRPPPPRRPGSRGWFWWFPHRRWPCRTQDSGRDPVGAGI